MNVYITTDPLELEQYLVLKSFARNIMQAGPHPTDKDCVFFAEVNEDDIEKLKNISWVKEIRGVAQSG